MKIFAMACAMSLLAAATTAAGDLAVSKSTLGNMGLGSMEVLADDAGTAIRGKGTSAAVWGGSQASWSLPSQKSGKFSFQPSSETIAQSSNNYAAAAEWHGKDSAASGGSLSFAGKFHVDFWADPTGFQLGVAVGAGISGGAAFAAAM